MLDHQKDNHNRVYRLWTKSDTNGNSPYRHICSLSTDTTPTKWILDSKWDRNTARDTWPHFQCAWCGKKRLPTSDHPDGAFPGQLFSQQVIDALADLLVISGDIYPLDMVGLGSRYWLYICWIKIDVLDMERTSMEYSGRILHAVFRPHTVLPPVFHIQQESGLLVTDSIKTRVEKYGFTGFTFQEL